ncbi:MAG: RrF2 family transcriptional regulator [Chloroflexota bacterium]
MTNILRISEAASLALHAMALLARGSERRVAAKDLAASLQASEAHLAKVMQRLVREGFVSSVRGPSGGFVLKRRAEDITLLEIYEAVDGPLVLDGCLLGEPVCDGKGCLLGGLVTALNRQVREYLGATRLSELAAGRFVASAGRT